MALTASTMSPLGSIAPDFSLLDPKTGKKVSRDDLMGDKGLLVMFICNHCPYVVHLEKALIALGLAYGGGDIGSGVDIGCGVDIGIVAISANDVKNYPVDAPELMAKKNYPFPYLYDEDQSVARAYDAVCTPDFFLYDSNAKLVYRGQFDDSRPGNPVPITGDDLKKAMEQLRVGETIVAAQKPSMGCNIKWT